MPWSFIVPAAVSLFSASQNRSAASQAADTTAAATDRSNALQQRMYEENVARQKPFYDVGVNALPELVSASKYTPFGMDQFQQDPGYAFRLSEGMKGLERSAAARGGLLSGSTLKGIERYGQGMASQEYTNAFNRYQAERAARLNPLQSLTGMAQTTANTLGTAGSNLAGSIGQNYLNQGINAGNAGMAGTRAMTSAYGDIANLYGRTSPNFGNLYGSGNYGTASRADMVDTPF